MDDSLSSLDEQVLEKICQSVLNKNPPLKNTAITSDIIFFKGMCFGIIQTEYNLYYNSANNRIPSSKEWDEMTMIVNSRIDDFFKSELMKK